jgi:predicted phosphodiesterase
MRIRVLSDLHLEFFDWQPPAARADVVVLAGDIHVGVKGLEWARERFPRTPVVYVAGNHEHYGARLQDVSAALREAGRRLGVGVLDGDERILDGVRFLGATLWTDFALYGSEPRRIARAMADAKYGMTDFRVIRYGETGLFRPEHAREIHVAQVQWLEKKLAEPFAGATVVVTHYLPHKRSIHPKYESDRLNAAFASDLSRLVRPPVALWIHGHTHESCDYVANGTRVVCNPRGYLPMEPNPAFDPTLVVET